MKRKILSTLTDIVLIILVLAFTDTLALRVLHSESIWLYIGLYIATYVVVFGAKRGNSYSFETKENKCFCRQGGRIKIRE